MVAIAVNGHRARRLGVGARVGEVIVAAHRRIAAAAGANVEGVHEVVARRAVVVAVQGVAPDVLDRVVDRQVIAAVAQGLVARFGWFGVEGDRGFIFAGCGVKVEVDFRNSVGDDLAVATQLPVVRVEDAVGAVLAILDIEVLAEDDHETGYVFVQLDSVGHRFTVAPGSVQHVGNRGAGNVLFRRETTRVDALVVVFDHFILILVVNLTVTAPHDHVVARVVHGYARISLLFFCGGIDLIFPAQFAVDAQRRVASQQGVADISLGVNSEAVGNVGQAGLLARPILEALPGDDEVAVGVHGDLRMLLRAVSETVDHELTQRVSGGVVSSRHNFLHALGADLRLGVANSLAVTRPRHREVAVGVHGHAGPLLHVIGGLVDEELGAGSHARAHRGKRVQTPVDVALVFFVAVLAEGGPGDHEVAQVVHGHHGEALVVLAGLVDAEFARGAVVGGAGNDLGTRAAAHAVRVDRVDHDFGQVRPARFAQEGDLQVGGIEPLNLDIRAKIGHGFFNVGRQIDRFGGAVVAAVRDYRW